MIEEAAEIEFMPLPGFNKAALIQKTEPAKIYWEEVGTMHSNQKFSIIKK